VNAFLGHILSQTLHAVHKLRRTSLIAHLSVFLPGCPSTPGIGGIVDFALDVIKEAKFALVGGLCK